MDAAIALPGLRPPVYPTQVQADWESVMKFRHFLRHAYAVPLDPERLDANVRRLVRAVAHSEPLVKELLQVLRRPD